MESGKTCESNDFTFEQCIPRDLVTAGNSCETRSKVVPVLGDYIAKCSYCNKWRVIPEKRKYQEIREKLTPFICEMAREWRPNVKCSDPSDVDPDNDSDDSIWAMDKPGIPQPPQGWDRTVRFRAKGGFRFADVVYKKIVSGPRPNPSFRSVVEIEKYLLENKEESADISQFSFKTPIPLNKNYVKKRTRKPQGNGVNLGRAKQTEPDNVHTSAWEAPIEITGIEAPIFNPVGRPAKMQVRRPRC